MQLTPPRLDARNGELVRRREDARLNVRRERLESPHEFVREFERVLRLEQRELGGRLRSGSSARPSARTRLAVAQLLLHALARRARELHEVQPAALRARRDVRWQHGEREPEQLAASRHARHSCRRCSSTRTVGSRCCGDAHDVAELLAERLLGTLPAQRQQVVERSRERRELRQQLREQVRAAAALQHLAQQALQLALVHVVLVLRQQQLRARARGGERRGGGRRRWR